jgi:hypothetical protein
MLFPFLVTCSKSNPHCYAPNYSFKGPELQLKVVCGVSIGDRDYQHINFMATPRGNPAAIQLFFAEYKHPMGVVLCCPVQDSVSQSGKLLRPSTPSSYTHLKPLGF